MSQQALELCFLKGLHRHNDFQSVFAVSGRGRGFAPRHLIHARLVCCGVL